MKLFRRRVWKYSKRATVLGLVLAILVLAGGGAVWARLGGGFGPSVTNASSVDLQKGLVGWWKMDGNANDSTPNRNNGVLSGISVVQGPVNSYNGENVTSIAATWPAATTTGNMLVAIVFINGGGTVTTPAGWTLRQGQGGSYGWYIYEINNAPSRSGSETFSVSSGQNMGLTLIELSGVNTSSPDDITSSYSSSSSTPSLGPVTLGANAGIALSVVTAPHGSCSTFGSQTAPNWISAMRGQREWSDYQMVNGGQAVNSMYTKCSTWKGAIFSFNAQSANRPSLINDRKGKPNSAYQTGRPKDINFSNTSSLNTSYLTVSAWVYYTASNASQTAVSRIKSASITGDWTLGTASNGTIGLTVVGKGSAFTSSGTGYPWNTWMMLTGTYDGTNIAFYLNGVLIATQAASTGGALPTGLDPLAIGGRSDGSYDYQNGGVDDVRIYNRAINANEVKALYNSYNDPLDLDQGEKGLVGWWKMDGNAKDSSPYRNNGILKNSPTAVADRKGRSSSAYQLNGTNSYIDAGDMSTFDGLKEMSISAWINPSTVPPAGDSSIETMVAKANYGSASGNAFFVRIRGTEGIDASFSDGINQLGCQTTTLPAANTWLFITAIMQADGTCTIYENGQQIVSTSGTPLSPGIANVTSPLRLGRSSWSNSDYFNGDIDDVRIYSRALTAGEVLAQYNSYNAQIAVGGSYGSSINLSKGLVGWWPMNGSSKDATPYRNNGTVTGATLVADRKGRSSSAYSFDGSTQYIQTADRNNFSPSAVSYNFTLSLWAMIPTNAAAIGNGSCGGAGGYMAGKAATSQFEWGLENDMNSRICWNLFTLTGSGAGSAGTVRSMNDGRWHLYTVTISPSNITLYIDGTSVASNSNPKTMGNGTAPVDIGSRSGAAGFMFAGSIDGVRIYNRVLSVAEIQALYSTYN